MTRIIFAWILFLVGVTAGCRTHETRAPSDLVSEAKRKVVRLSAHLRAHPNDDAARLQLGLLQWVHLREASEARKHFEVIVGPDAHETADTAKSETAALDSTPSIATFDRERALARAALMIMAGARERGPDLRSHARGIIEQATVSDDAWVGDLAWFAARSWAADHGSVRGDDRAYERFFAGLSLGELPARVQQPLLSLRADLARRQGEPYAEYYARQGCVQRWQTTPLQGSKGELELGRPRRGSYADPAAQDLGVLACVVRLWNGTATSGVRWLRTWIEAADGHLRLEVRAEEPVRVYLDGRLLLRTDIDSRWPDDVTVLRMEVPPGPHALEVATAVPQTHAWVLVRATDGRGNSATTSTKPAVVREPFRGDVEDEHPRWQLAKGVLAGRLMQPFRDYLALDAALAHGRTDEAESIATRLRQGDFAEGLWLVAQFEQEDPSRSSSLLQARARRELERALEVDASLERARIDLFDIALDRGEHDEVVRQLDALPKGSLASVDGQLLYWRAYLSAGSEHLAARALERARTRQPEHCRVLMALRSLAQRYERVEQEDDFTERLARCGGTLGLRARHATERGQLQRASALWDEALERSPDDIDAVMSLADTSLAMGKFDETLASLRDVVTYDPYRIDARIRMVDVLLARGQIELARREMTAALGLVPHSSALRRSAEQLGIDDDLWKYRVDGQKALAEYRASGTTYAGVSEVLVLDRSVARVYEDFGARVLVHLVVELHAKEALDRYGEVQIPEQATLLTLHSIKPDGSVRDPESIPGKDGLSLRHLEIGDVVEYEYVIEQAPVGLLPGYVDITTFRFQSAEIPYHRSELLVVHPREMAVIEDRRNAPPTMEQRAEGELVVRSWRADHMQRLGVEPYQRHPLDVVPNVRVFTQLDPKQWLQTLALQIRSAQRTNPELRALARRLTQGADTDAAKLERTFAHVVDRIVEQGDISMPATVTLAERRGNRLMLLRSLLNESGVRNELWLARSRVTPDPHEGGHPLLEFYDTPVLAVWTGEAEPRIVTTSSDVMPLGYVPPGLDGASAYRLHLRDGDGPHVLVSLPARGDEFDRRHYRLRYEIDRDGSGSVEGVIELEGMEAIMWRQALRDLDEERVHEAFEQAELARLGREYVLQQLEIDNQKALSEPLRLRFRAGLEGLGLREDGQLVVRSALVPANVAAAFVSSARRESDLMIPYAPVVSADVELQVRGGDIVAGPRSRHVHNERGEYRRTSVVAKNRASLHVTVHSRVRRGVVTKAQYPELERFGQTINNLEQDVIRIR